MELNVNKERDKLFGERKRRLTELKDINNEIARRIRMPETLSISYQQIAVLV